MLVALLQNTTADTSEERKYFDSGDYALSKAGKNTEIGVTGLGSQHPLPENIPHLSSPSPINGGANNVSNGSIVSNGHNLAGGQSRSPVKESSFLHRETSVDDQDNETSGIEGVGMTSPKKETTVGGWQS